MTIKEKFHSLTTKMRVRLANILLTKDAHMQHIEIEQMKLLNSGRAQGALVAYREFCNYIAQTQDLDRVKEYAKNRYNQYLHHNGTGELDGCYGDYLAKPMRKVEHSYSDTEKELIHTVAAKMMNYV